MLGRASNDRSICTAVEPGARAGERSYRFEIDPEQKANLAKGLDEIRHSLTFENAIAAFEAGRLPLPAIVLP